MLSYSKGVGSVEFNKRSHPQCCTPTDHWEENHQEPPFTAPPFSLSWEVQRLQQTAFAAGKGQKMNFRRGVVPLQPCWMPEPRHHASIVSLTLALDGSKVHWWRFKPNPLNLRSTRHAYEPYHVRIFACFRLCPKKHGDPIAVAVGPHHPSPSPTRP